MRALPIAILAAAGVWTVAPDAGQAPRQPPGTAVILAQIVDATDARPIPRAVVTLVAGPAPSTPAGGAPPPAQARRAVAVANGEGRVVFRDVPAGQYSLAASLDGYAPGASGRKRPGGPGRAFQVADAARLTNLTVPMWRLGSVSGFVRDDRAEPAVGVYMTAMRLVMNAGRLELASANGEATDERGYYRISNLQPGRYLVGFRVEPQTVPLSTADAYRAAVVSGTTSSVTQEWSSTGALRLQGSSVGIGDWELYSWGNPALLPGADGSVRRHPSLYYPGAQTASEAAVIDIAPGDDRSGVDITTPLLPAVRVSGVLMGPDGPAANHGIRLLVTGASEPFLDIPVGYGLTDAAGRFTFLAVLPGSYVVSAYRVERAGGFRFMPPAAGAPPGARVEQVAANPNAPPSLFGETPVTVGSANLDNITVALRPGARISGRVVFDGAAAQPAAAALQKIAITIRPLAGMMPGTTEARVDAEGRFSFAGYPPGRYVLFSATPPGPEWSIASFRIGGIDAAGQAFTLGESDVSDAVLTFTDKTISLSGTVRPPDGKGDADTTVVLVPADTEAWFKSGMSPRRMASVATTDSGSYQIRVALPGDYLVFAIPAEIAPDIDRAFLKRFLPSAVRVTLAAGDSKAQPLAIAGIR